MHRPGALVSVVHRENQLVWLLAGLDAAAGLYLIVVAYRRERRDKPGVLVVGILLITCAVLLAGLAAWQAAPRSEPAVHGPAVQAGALEATGPNPAPVVVARHGRRALSPNAFRG